MQLVRTESKVAELQSDSQKRTFNAASHAHQALITENEELRERLSTYHQRMMELQLQLDQNTAEREQLAASNGHLLETADAERRQREQLANALDESHLKWQRSQDNLLQKEGLIREWRTRAVVSV